MNRLPLIFLVSVMAVAALHAGELLQKAGVEAGLAVHLGATDGEVEAGLTNEGRMLVHGLALTDAARDAARLALFSKGIYGLASVETWRDRTRLPYASNLANLVVADLDALGATAPAAAELERITAPEGVLLLRKNGAWTRSVKPRPAAMDDWGHFDHAANGDGSSTDMLVEPVRQQQWLTSLQAIPESGNPAGYDPGAGVRISGRYTIMDVNDGYAAPDKSGKGSKGSWVLQARDAFNGTPLWTVPREKEVAGARWAMAADDGVAYAWLKRDGELTALDLASGKTLRTFPGTKGAVTAEAACVRIAGKNLVVGLRERLVCFDPANAAERWSFSREGLETLGPVVDAARGRVYCLLSKPVEGRRASYGGRWPTSGAVQSVAALDLATGKLVWECTEVASKAIGESKGQPAMRGIGQLIPAEKYLVAFGSKAISGGQRPFMASIDLGTGKVAHMTDEPFKSSYNTASYNMLLRDGAAWFAGAFTNVWRYDPASGEVTRPLSNPWNQRCTRFAATPRWLMFGQAAYYGADMGGVQVSVGRAGCALPNTPANGLTYFTPTACGCTTLVRGFQAMTGDAAPTPVEDAARLVSAGSGPLAITAPTDIPAGPVAADWLKQERAGARETEPVTAGDLTLVAIVQQHRLEARRAGKAVWNFVAGGRISSPPVIAGGAAIFGSHDGWIYAVGSDGRLRWKYFLAPSERLIGINAQLESAWPVYGVALLDGKIVASAGTHVELDGGVTVAALDPATGQPAWVKHLQKQPSKVPPGGQGANIVPWSFINSVPRIEGGEIVLGDGGRRGGSFQFSPDTAEDELNTRLNSPPPKKK